MQKTEVTSNILKSEDIKICTGKRYGALDNTDWALPEMLPKVSTEDLTSELARRHKPVAPVIDAEEQQRKNLAALLKRQDEPLATWRSHVGTFTEEAL